MAEKKEHRGEATRERILHAAGELFAEKGFGETTIRDICHRAEVNLASINYHFHDKENLFSDVIEYWFEVAQNKYPPDFRFSEAGSAQARLRQFVWNMLVRRYDPDLPQWFPQLMSRNIQFARAHERPSLQRFKEENRRIIREVIIELLPGQGPDHDERVRTAVAGTMGIILFHLRPRPADEEPRLPVFRDAADFERVVDQLYTFVAGGIAALKPKE